MIPRYFAPAFRVMVNGSNLEADVSKNVQQVAVVSKPGTLDTFSLTLINEYPDLRWTHIKGDSDLFYAGNEIKIGMGYVDEIEDVFDGEITKVSPVFPEDGMPTVMIEGHTRMHWLQGDKKTRTFRDVTDKQIVQRVGEEAGLNVDAEDTDAQLSYVMQANKTDLEFLKERAGLINYELGAEGKTLTFRRARVDESEVLTLVWGHPQRAQASGGDVKPLRSFSPTLSTVDQVDSVDVRGYDPASKQEIVGSASTGDEASMGGAQTGGTVRSSALGRGRRQVRVDRPVQSQSEADQHARALLNERAMNFVGGTAATIGLPALRAGKVVCIEGLGFRFSGRYYIAEATHTVSGSGYLTDLQLQRNAVE